MRLFFDTNIFLDLLMDRRYAPEAQRLLERVAEGEIVGIVADITLLNIDYVAGKQEENVRDFLEAVNRYFRVVGADNALMEKALDMPERDFEDNLQYILAMAENAEGIVSNDRNFPRRDLPVYPSDEAVTL